MKLYLDNDNLFSLVQQLKRYPDKEIVNDCLRMLKKQLTLVYNFRKEDIDEQLYQLWFNNQVQGRGSQENSDLFCSPPFPHRPIGVNSFVKANWETVSSTYLCSGADIDRFYEKQSILFSRNNEEIGTLQKLFWEDYSFSHTYILTRGDISYGWKELETDGHCLPCTDILLVDRYLFVDPSSFKDNLFPLIQRLTCRVNAPVNLVVFVERKDYHSDDFVQLVSALSKSRGNNQHPLYVTIIVYPPSMEGGKGLKKTVPHDRFILTNYRRFCSGPSFGSYFGKNREVATTGMDLTVHSLANMNEYLNARFLVDFFQKNVIDRIQRLPTSSSYIYGAKRSNMFVFK